MNTITRHFTTAEDAAIVTGRVAGLARRAAKKGIETDLRSTTEVTAENTYRVEVTFSDLVRFAGGWTLVAVADATSTDEPMIFTFADDTTVDGDIDMSRCDHCGRNVRRNKVLFVRSEAGDVKQVGGSCAQDFLGRDPFWATLLWDAVNDEISDDDRSSGRFEFPTSIVLAAAIDACRLGYVKRNAEHGTPTATIVTAMLNGAFWNHRDFAGLRQALAEAPAATVTVQQVLDWMREQEGEFGLNLRRIADSTNIGAKAIGLAAYAPAGAARWREEMIAKAAQKAADEAARANAESVPVGKVIVEGVVVSTRLVESEYGSTLKMKVTTDAGWSVWGSVPKSLLGYCEWDDDYVQRWVAGAEIGDRVRFTATIEPSADDRLFGFFKRPTKAEIIERAAVSC